MHVKYTHEYFYILTQNIHITFKIAIKFSQITTIILKNEAIYIIISYVTTTQFV